MVFVIVVVVFTIYNFRIIFLLLTLFYFYWLVIFSPYEATNQHELLHSRDSETATTRWHRRPLRLPRVTPKWTEWNCRQQRILPLDANLTDLYRYLCRLLKMRTKISLMTALQMTDVDVSQCRKKISFRLINFMVGLSTSMTGLYKLPPPPSLLLRFHASPFLHEIFFFHLFWAVYIRGSLFEINHLILWHNANINAR